MGARANRKLVHDSPHDASSLGDRANKKLVQICVQKVDGWASMGARANRFMIPLAKSAIGRTTLFSSRLLIVSPSIGYGENWPGLLIGLLACEKRRD